MSAKLSDKQRVHARLEAAHREYWNARNAWTPGTAPTFSVVYGERIYGLRGAYGDDLVDECLEERESAYSAACEASEDAQRHEEQYR